jgi:hypothetical protein
MEFRFFSHQGPSYKPSHMLAEATIVWDSGPLAGLMLRGFGIWRTKDGDISITPPSRTYMKDGKTHYYWHLTSVDPDTDALHTLRRQMVEAYKEWRSRQ